MPRDPQKAIERKRRFRQREHEARYGPGAGDMRGRHGNHAKGSANARWNRDARLLSSHGYVLIRVGTEHPLAFGNGYAYEHMLVWIAAYGPLAAGETLHHKSKDKTDNRLSNLEKLTRSEHGRHHAEERDRDALGMFL